MLQKFENFKKNKDKNINKTRVEYNLYNFSIQTIYTNYGCVIFYKNNNINLCKLNNIKNFLQALALISYVYNFRTKSE